MITYLQHREIDKTKWNRCIESSLISNLYACSWYLDCVCGRWDALVEDDYDYVMPLPLRRKFNMQYLFLPSMIQQLGIFSSEEITSKKVQEFVNNIPKKILYGQINLNHNNPVDKLIIPSQTQINLELNLNKSYDTLRESYSENLKRNLKKFSEEKIKVIINHNVENIIQLFIDNKGSELKSLPKDFYHSLRNIVYQLQLRGHCETWEAYVGQDLHAGIIFAKGFKKFIFLFSATSLKAKELSVMHYLIDTFIKANAEKDIVLDFEGSNYPSLYRFYKNFGAEEVNYHQIKINRLPWPLNLFA
ncbi:MAG: hypothetical protein PHR81_02835 [Bacteroidales bacterium]|nr:hypothetical protein [Bacteroidales bacterium]MDD4213724.1 hypothetical protein [Bacteroidales bacterium]